MVDRPTWHFRASSDAVSPLAANANLNMSTSKSTYVLGFIAIRHDGLRLPEHRAEQFVRMLIGPLSPLATTQETGAQNAATPRHAAHHVSSTEVAVKLLTISEVADALSVSKARGYELVRKGLIPAVRIGRQVRVHPDHLELWLSRGGTATTLEPVEPGVVESPWTGQDAATAWPSFGPPAGATRHRRGHG